MPMTVRKPGCRKRPALLFLLQRGTLSSERSRRGAEVLKAILTDSHFLIPLIVLVFGIALLVFLH
jgi:hypothetical protein